MHAFCKTEFSLVYKIGNGICANLDKPGWYSAKRNKAYTERKMPDDPRVCEM